MVKQLQTVTIKLKPKPRLFVEDEPIVQPPSTMTVEHNRKAILFTPDGKALVRTAGF